VKQPKKKSVERFPGLTLSEEERQALAAMRAGRKRLSIRRWRRIRILELLDKEWTMQDAADAAGTYPREVRRVGRRFVVHYTPKHGSWPNPAEIEVSLWSRECMGRDRIATLCELKYRTHLWNKTADRARRKINWRFTIRDARRLFRCEPGTAPAPKD
jgi:hypothetical protein